MLISAAVSPTRLFKFWADEDGGNELLTQLVTVQPDGRPYVRTMHCSFNEGAFQFTTHAMSSKVTDIKLNGHVSLQFFFGGRAQRQVVVCGDAQLNTAEENVAQWKSRARARNVLAWDSRLAAPPPARREAHDDDVPLPMVPFFCGFVVKPITFDFSEKIAEGRRTNVHMVRLYDAWAVAPQRLVLNSM